MRRTAVACIIATVTAGCAITAFIADRNYHHDLSQHFNPGFCNYLQVTQAVERCRIQNSQDYQRAQNWLHAAQVTFGLAALCTTVAVVLVALILTRRPRSASARDAGVSPQR